MLHRVPQLYELSAQKMDGMQRLEVIKAELRVERHMVLQVPQPLRIFHCAEATSRFLQLRIPCLQRGSWQASLNVLSTRRAFRT